MDSVDEEQRIQAKQCTLPSVSKLNLSRLRGLVAEYIIEDMLPLLTVESQLSRDWCAILPVHHQTMCNYQIERKSFTLFLDKAYNSVIAKVKATLETVERVCTTADLWTASRRSYLGITVHWIDPSTLKRRKAAIACARITGRHIYDILAAKIESFHQSFGLSGKVSATVTDNGSNFIKAFASFVVPDVSSVPELSDSVEDDNECEEEEVTFVDVVKVMVPDEGDTQDDLT